MVESLAAEYKSITRSFWERHDDLVKVAALITKNPVWEVALPMDEGKVKQWWKPRDNQYSLPKLKTNDGGLTGHVYGEVQRTWNSIMEENEKTMGYPPGSLGRFKLAKPTWTRAITYFFHYWCLNSNLTKEEAYERACEAALCTLRPSTMTRFCDI
jgi:hypothetical protein